MWGMKSCPVAEVTIITRSSHMPTFDQDPDRRRARARSAGRPVHEGQRRENLKKKSDQYTGAMPAEARHRMYWVSNLFPPYQAMNGSIT